MLLNDLTTFIIKRALRRKLLKILSQRGPDEFECVTQIVNAAQRGVPARTRAPQGILKSLYTIPRHRGENEPTLINHRIYFSE